MGQSRYNGLFYFFCGANAGPISFSTFNNYAFGHTPLL
jgi:hypothetical protein